VTRPCKRCLQPLLWWEHVGIADYAVGGIRLRSDRKITPRTTNGASTSRLPWDTVPYTSPTIRV